MKSIILYKSIHKGNTQKIAQVIAQGLDALIKDASQVSPKEIGQFDLIGLGSGIYGFRHHQALLSLAGAIKPRKDLHFFIFSTAGAKNGTKYHKALRNKLKNKGLPIIGEFSCPGFDCFGPLKLIGGTNKGRPNEKDLAAAQKFAQSLEQK